MFRLTPPQRHDIDPAKSEVLAYIMANLACELGRAIRAFNSMRNKKSQVLVYDMVHRQWRGCDWVPPEDEDRVALLLRTINDLKRDVAYLKTSVKKHERLFGQLERKRSRKREEEEDETVEPEPESEPEQQQAAPPEKEAADGEDWFKAMREALAETEQKASAPSVAPRSSSWDSTAPTEYPWENAEDDPSDLGLVQDGLKLVP
jgi:hypothetical protein